MTSKFGRKTDGGTIVTPPACEVKMTKGGLQLRYKLPTGGKMSISEAPEDGDIEERAHSHMGLQEIYTIHEGWIKIWHADPLVSQVTMLTPGGTCVFVAEPKVLHLVMKGPGAVFTTQTVGTPIPNPDRSNNDWYPALGEFTNIAKKDLTHK